MFRFGRRMDRSGIRRSKCNLSPSFAREQHGGSSSHGCNRLLLFRNFKKIGPGHEPGRAAQVVSVAWRREHQHDSAFHSDRANKVRTMVETGPLLETVA